LNDLENDEKKIGGFLILPPKRRNVIPGIKKRNREISSAGSSVFQPEIKPFNCSCHDINHIFHPGKTMALIGIDF
jgi:hypothetical protein